MVILASASPRRREILESLGVDIKIITADVDESFNKPTPSDIAMQIAEKKCRAVYEKLDAELSSLPVISADTIVVIENEIMGKPKDEADACRMLKKLSGSSHEVTTGICVGINGSFCCSYATTKVFIDELTDAQIKTYIDSRDPFDKAGAYGIQGIFSKHVKKIDGCYFNVVGLPVNALAHLFLDATGKELF